MEATQKPAVTPAPQDDNLEQHVLANLKNSSSDNQPSYTKEEFTQLVAYASFLQQLDKERAKTPERGLSLEGVYFAAQDIGVDPSYVEKALQIYFPTAAEKKVALDAVKAEPSRNLQIKLFWEDMNALTQSFLETLRQTNPSGQYVLKEEKIFNNYNDNGFSFKYYSVSSEDARFLFWDYKIQSQQLLAELKINHFYHHTILHLTDHYFVTACAKQIQKLKELRKHPNIDKTKIEYNYKLE